MFKFYIGCDVSKNSIDVALRHDKVPVHLDSFENSETGFEELASCLLSNFGASLDECFVCFENTGSYSVMLAMWLADRNVVYCEESPLRIHNSLGLKRGKSDRADALDICQYAYEKRETLKPSTPDSDIIRKLKTLITRRDMLIKTRTAIKLSSTEQKYGCHTELLDVLQIHTEELEQKITGQIKEIDVLIERTLASTQSVQQNSQLLKSIIGLGPVITANLIAQTHNFTRFADARKYCSFIGIAPFLHGQTGKQKGVNRVSNYANKQVKSLLYNAATVACRHDPVIKRYYTRKIDEGKSKGVIYNAVKNKLVQRVFGVINRQTPYSKLQYV